MSILETYRSLTSNKRENRSQDLLDFANQMGWNPSYYFKYDDDFDNGQVIVEHRLEYTAVLSFLNTPYQELSKEEQRKLVNISYGHL